MSTRFAAAYGVVALLAAVLTGPALAHEGHDHGAVPPPLSKTDAFELVAVPRDGTLTLFLDRFRTNEPVPGATIEVETPDGPRVATATTDGGYALPVPWLSKPGRHELLATVTAGDAVDVLTVAVTVPDPKVAAAAAPAKPAPAQAALARVSEVAFGKREIPAAGERLLPLRLVERQGDEALLAAVAHVHDLVEADALQLGADLLENLPAIRVRLARDNEQVSAGEVRQRVLVALLVDAEAVDLDRADAVLVRAGGVVVVVAVVLVGVHPVAFRSSREAILPGPSRG
jgi:hypothetical protein